MRCQTRTTAAPEGIEGPMISLPFAGALAAAVLTTSFVSGIFGMAGGMILMGILLVIMPVAAAMVLHGLTQMASNGWRAWLWREHIQWRISAWYAAGAIVSAVAFAAVALVPNKPTALLILGLTPCVGLLLPVRLAPNVTRHGHGFICGAICTALQLMAGVSGPILDVFFVRSALDRRQMVATKAAIQVLGHFLKVAYFGQLLGLGADTIAPTAVILAITLALVGTQLSRRVLDAISDAQFRSWSRGVIGAVAGVYLVQGVFLTFFDWDIVAARVTALIWPV
jgi:uncharacterized membrane protein YfcA